MQRNTPTKPNLRQALVGPLIFISIGLYCFYAPESLLDDPGWEFVQNKKLLGYACGAIFLGGGLLFLNQLIKPLGYRKASKCCELVAIVLLIVGWGYTFWEMFGS